MKSCLHCTNGKKTKQKLNVNIKQPLQYDDTHKELMLERRAQLKVCCSNKGTAYIRSYFPKDFYTPQEMPCVTVEIDNSQCELAIVSVEAIL